MTTTYRTLLCVLPLLLASSAAAQTVVFQNGTTLLDDLGDADPMNDIYYDGTEDAEFRSADPGLTTPNPDADEISVDGNDGGNLTQAALRFTNLLESQGGLVPDGVVGGGIPISNATLSIFMTSGSDEDANIEFHRVLTQDPDTGDWWQEDDTFDNLTGFLAPLPGQRFVEYPFHGQFDDVNDGRFKGSLGDAIGGATEITPERTAWIPTVAELESNPNLSDFEKLKNTDNDGEDLLEELEPSVLDGSISFASALEQSIHVIDVTADVQAWLRDGAPVQGWAITNNTGDGWDFFTSEYEGTFDELFFDGETELPGLDLDPSDGLDPLPAAFEYAFPNDDPMTPEDESLTPSGITVKGEYLRPRLTITYQGGNGPADLNFDQLVDEDDLAIFLENFGSEINSGGVLPAGTPGDIDFDLDVDPADWLLFKEAFSIANPPLFASLIGGSVSVPEPSSVVVAALACLAFGFYGRQRVL